MDQRRFILFIALSMSILMIWSGVVMPRLFPNLKKPAADAKEDPSAESKPDDVGPAIAEIPGEAQPEQKPVREPIVIKAEKHPHDGKVMLGSRDPDSGYFLEVQLTTEGAAVRSIWLNDPRYRRLERREEPLALVEGLKAPIDVALEKHFETYRTMQVSIPSIDKDLGKNKLSLNSIDWKLDAKHSPEEATFRVLSPDGTWEIVKRYSLVKTATPPGATDSSVRDLESPGYQLKLDLTLKNLSGEKKETSYTLQGPIGMPLENAENTRKFRDVRMGFLNSDGSTKHEVKTAAQVVKDQDADKPEEWTKPIRYLGVDIQYFAALLVPQGDQSKQSYVAVSRPQLIEKAKEESHSQISVEVTSNELEIGPGESLTHEWALFTGPKRESLLNPFDAGSIVDFGFASSVARGMLWLLKFFHDKVGLPWGLAIVALTIVVRGCMFPISKKQAVGAKKMKDLQPKIAELKKKYGDDKEKFARAQMELFAKNNYNPLAGCLPVFIQLPIFIGLYNSLNSAVELRMARFLYIDNLAGPDALFHFPFRIPLLGNEFNLLPIITIGLFIAQQKMFMPPPTDEQQAAQQKMMNFMMIFMGFMFYTVPAGLCIYFIASSLWGMGERKVLDLTGKDTPPPPDDDAEKPSETKSPPKDNFWTRMLAQADAAGNQAGLSTPGREGTDERNGKAKKDKRKR